MNNYFAKLALRATVGNAATQFAASTTGKVGDPFEEITAHVPSSRPESGRRAQRIEAVDFGFSTPKTQGPFEATTPSMATARPEQQPVRGPAVLDPKPSGELPIHRDRETIEPEAQQVTQPVPPSPQPQVLQRDNSEPGMRAPALMPPVVQPVRADEGVPPLSPEQVPVQERLTALEHKQDILLRKADAFMGSLLERRKLASSEAESVPENVPTSPNILRPDHAEQIRPQPAALPTRLQDDADRPSLVIGKLTVEIVPPTPAPPARPQPVVVVNGARGRKNTFPASRRFGLGQF